MWRHPFFLLGAVAAFISVLICRINRVIDRPQFIHGIPENDAAKAFLKSDLPRPQRRANLLNRALSYAIASAILTALIIVPLMREIMIALHDNDLPV